MTTPSERQAIVRRIEGGALPMPGNDIDTDRIIPARYLKAVTFEGMGQYAFYDERYDADGRPREHPFNDPRYRDATILVVSRNFGCGSSREHAPQALMRHGIRAIVGESFAEIFAGNCTAIGVPTMTLPRTALNTLMAQIKADPTLKIAIDLEQCTLTAGESTYTVEMAASSRTSLLSGKWDSTSEMLSNIEAIERTAGRLPYLHDFGGEA